MRSFFYLSWTIHWPFIDHALAHLSRREHRRAVCVGAWGGGGVATIKAYKHNHRYVQYYTAVRVLPQETWVWLWFGANPRPSAARLRTAGQGAPEVYKARRPRVTCQNRELGRRVFIYLFSFFLGVHYNMIHDHHRRIILLCLKKLFS